MSAITPTVPNPYQFAPPGYLRDVIRQLETPWPDNRLINIVCHGHSVPAGYFKTPEVRSFDSYPHLLHVLLKSRFPYAVANVIVTARGSEESESGEARFEEVLRHRPDVITIDYGLNDRKIGLVRAEAAWRKMIETAIAERIPAILLTPTPDLNADNQNPDDPVNQHASQIRSLAEEYGIALANSQAAFQAYCRGGGGLADLMSHSNHPNRAGHQLVADALAAWFVSDSAP